MTGYPCFLVVLLSLIVTHYCIHPSKIPFRPYYPSSHHYNVHCQRVVASPTTFIDLDYEYAMIYLDDVYVGIDLTISTMNRFKSGWLAVGVNTTARYRTITQGFNYGYWNMTILDLVPGDTHFFRKSAYLTEVERNQTVAVLLLGNTQSKNRSLVEFSIETTMNLSDLTYSNRTQCYDNFNFIFYLYALRMYTRVMQVLISSCFTVMVLIASIALFVVRKRNRMRGRFVTSVISFYSLLLAYQTIPAENIAYLILERGSLDGVTDIRMPILLDTAALLLYFGYTVSLLSYEYKLLMFQRLKLLYRFNMIRDNRFIASKLCFNLLFGLYALTKISITLAITMGHSYREYESVRPLYWNVAYQLIAWMGIIVAIGFIDSLVNVRVLFQHNIRYFFSYDDPLAFRTEAIATLFGAILFTTSILLSLKLQINSFLAGQTIVVAIFDILSYTSMFLVFGSYSIVIEELVNMILERVGKTKPAMNSDMVEDDLEDTVFYNMIYNYSKNELSSENFMIRQDMLPFKRNGQLSIDELRRIYDTYIDSSAEIQVNVPAKTCKLIKSTTMKQTTKKALPSQHFFSSTSDELLLSGEDTIPFDDIAVLYSDVITNISDTYARFKGTEECHNYFKFKQDITQL